MNITVRLICLSLLIANFASVSFANDLPVRSNLREMIPFITSVKSQSGRNMCTVFSLTALVESLYIKETGVKSVDFSEEWVQHLATLVNASGGAKGSTVRKNFESIKRHGITFEDEMPFTSGKWKENTNDEVAVKMCGQLKGKSYIQCLYGKTNPNYLKMSDDQLMSQPYGDDYVKARQSAAQMKKEFTSRLTRKTISSSKKVKSLLLQNKPVAVELDIYYGTWNLAKADDFGIHHQPELFEQGVVTYPEKGSMDHAISRKHPARHAVLIIGYDDDIVLSYEKRMKDGSLKTFERKGIYYIKNSWGTKKFGSKFRYGKSKIKGLGMISQDFVHDLGLLTSVELR